MKSVDKLREWADGLRCIWLDPNDHSIIVTSCDDMPPSIDCVSLRDHVNGILDGINREFDSMVRSLTIDAIPATSENMADAGWVRLPLDADGVPIHVGERVQIIGNDPGTVSHMSLADDGWRVYVKYDGGLGTGSGEPSYIRHHRDPTVEDVLEEFVARWMETHHDDIPALKAEYAARLRLAGEDA